jgi:uncharacterized membrane protein
LGLAILLLVNLVSPARAFQETQPPVVQAVMFWLESCGHCQYVIEEVLPPIQTQYGEQFELLMIQLVTTEEIDRLYQTAAAFGIAKEDVGVPFLVIGDQALSSSRQIADELPGLIEQYLAQGGVATLDLPSLAGLLPTGLPEAGSEADPAALTGDLAEADPTPQPVENSTATPIKKGQFSNGFALAVFVLLGMLAASGYAGVVIARGSSMLPGVFSARWAGLAFLLLCLAGLGVAGYLAYVETQLVEALCGPVGDCNTVQSSPYARLFGILPVGVLGMFGYLAILAGWLYPRLRDDRLALYAPRLVLGMTIFGVLYSIYLTYLEIFVIRAVCMWCLSSAAIVTLLMLLSLHPALRKRVALADPGR